MGRGNVCVFQEYEGLYYIDNDHLHEYRRVDEAGEGAEFRLLGELSYEELSGGDWLFDEWQSHINWEDTKRNLTHALMAKFPSLHECNTWIEHDRFALLENNLFYIAVADNEWSQAVMLVQKDHWCYDYSGLQKRHYQSYLDGIRDCLFEQFDTLGTYGGAWTSGRISRADFQSGGEKSA